MKLFCHGVQTQKLSPMGRKRNDNNKAKECVPKFFFLVLRGQGNSGQSHYCPTPKFHWPGTTTKIKKTFNIDDVHICEFKAE